MKRILALAVLLFGAAVLPGRAQPAVPPPAPEYQPLTRQQLDELLGPIALYPDPLIAQILPAATLPTQIVLADRYVSAGGDPGRIEQQPWDVSVQALAHYPNVLKWLDDNLNWTIELGQAFLNQQEDVMNSIQRLRAAARRYGNLQSTPQQKVIVDGGYIEIVPANPQVIYVPVYEPAIVFYRYGYGTSLVTFSFGFPIGIWLNFDFDWHHHHLIVWKRNHPRPVGWWHERPDRRAAVIRTQTSAWQPVQRSGSFIARRDDRGWNRPAAHPSSPTANHSAPRPLQPRKGIIIKTTQPAPPPAPVRPAAPAPQHGRLPAPTVNRPPPAAPQRGRSPAPTVNRPPPAPAPVQRRAPGGKPAPNNPFIGIQSSRQTRDFSERGKQSMQAPPRSTPAPRSAPSTARGNGNSSGRLSPPKR